MTPRIFATGTHPPRAGISRAPGIENRDEGFTKARRGSRPFGRFGRRRVDVPEATAKTWLKKGRRGEEPYATFAAELDDAREVSVLGAGPMDRDELLLVVSIAARKGSVQAMKLALELLKLEDAQEPAELDPFDEFDAFTALANRQGGAMSGRLRSGERKA